jgi:glutathione peroxidase-family protein
LSTPHRNVASRRSTPDLQALHKDLGDQLAVLAFPCNQFGAQEPGNDEEIQQFCKRSYDVDFPVFKKINVNGDNTDPLWQFLKSKNIILLCVDEL